MSRVTLASLREEVAKLHIHVGVLDTKNKALDTALLARKNANKALEAEVLRLRILSSEMRGFIMAHHSSDHPMGGVTVYKEPYSADGENTMELPLIRYPFMDAKINPDSD